MILSARGESGRITLLLDPSLVDIPGLYIGALALTIGFARAAFSLSRWLLETTYRDVDDGDVPDVNSHEAADRGRI